VESGGFLGDVIATIAGASFSKWDYNGAITTPVPALLLTLQVEGEDDTHDQYYSMGSPKDFTPSRDGKTLQATGKAGNLNSGSNGMIFFGSIVNSGFPEDQLEGGDASALVGAVCHFIRQPAPRRPGMRPNATPSDREPTILVVDQVISLPGEAAPKAKAKAMGGKATATPKAAAKAKDPDEGDMEEGAVGAVMEVLGDKPDGVTRQQMPGLVFAKVKDRQDRNAIVQLAFNEEFLSAVGRPWSYDDGKITLG